MDTWQCTECGYTHQGEEPPGICPECEAPALAFDLVEEEQEIWEDDWGDDDDWDEDWDEDVEDDFDIGWDE